ncbi:MAG: hypothetical protein D8M57_15510 [Candidatus Scalindua sp. AMX11]|nr:MAG: hypothetical protein DWQ00_06010 [Candidatus Scalindua sp.]NOG82554.1 hypothetical protein [Planctomycetota bacterium]RZV93983.1 MAG: hypothetical protein EX341_03770 [Candidatus Scalindua sp. SCAELEC01]TDE63974.1 MAG: hypothetical protein D8M57_15510 [Candidatus Scalindua sp. AMX11]GJQ57451.1 MAG: hypothetical protein SCALA701_02520 [Candidatus Scalindua sp.]
MKERKLVYIKKIGKKIKDRIYIDLNKNYHNTVFLAGTGRGGTTWVSNIINYNNEYRYMFEPFHSGKVDSCRNFRYRQYLRPDDRDSKFIESAKLILSGKVKDPWIDSKNKKFISSKRLIKDIRASHFLKWIYANFPGIPIILLLRHPCAVVHSKLKLNWESHLGEFLSQDELLEDFLNPFKDAIVDTNSMFEKLIFQWCIEYYVPLKQFNKGEIHLAFYEGFCENPRDEIERLFSFLGKNFDDKVLLNIKTPSALSRKFSAIVTGRNLIDSWRGNITKEQIRRAVEILAMFGLDRIYTEDSMPDIENTYKLLNNN